MAEAIALEEVVFRYGRTPVLQLPRFVVSEGERVFLHGPSGSGKTTLLGVIAGVLVAQAGTVRVLGRELRTTSATARDRLRGAEMGYIFQGFNLLPYLSARENVALPCALHAERRRGLRGRSVREETERLLGRLDLAEVADRPVTELSTGQQQRVAIARATIGWPRLLIADEPTSALDADRREQFLELLFGMCAEAGAALLFVSHDRGLAHRFDRQMSLPELNDVAATRGAA